MQLGSRLAVAVAVPVAVAVAAATAPTQPPAWELPPAVGVALKKEGKKTAHKQVKLSPCLGMHIEQNYKEKQENHDFRMIRLG